MGLEIVELIMRIEEKFAIEIPDSDAELLVTPGALCDLIESKLSLYRVQSSSSCATSLSFYAVRRQLMQLGIERQRVKPNTRLAELWPATERRHNWQALAKGLNYPLPTLHRSPGRSFFTLLPLSVFPICLWLSPTTAFAFFALYLLLLWFGAQLTEPFAVHPPDFLYSVADLSRRLAPRFNTSAGAPAPVIWQQVRAIIADELGLPLEQVTRDADWFRDLGVG